MLDPSKLKIFGGCLNPQYVINKHTGKPMLTACRKCVACSNTLASFQSTRVRNEITKHKYSIMFTLTYSNEFIPRWEMIVDSNGIPQLRPIGRCEFLFDSCPLNSIDDKGNLLFDYQEYLPSIEGDFCPTHFASVCKKDVQNFIKRLRFHLSNLNIDSDEKKVRYYVCSEYGPSTYRPHYHGILFFDNEVIAGAIKDCILKSWGEFKRIKGRRNNFAFRPFARISLTAPHIKSCDPNTSYYVGEYVASNSSLPQVLGFRSTRPFHLGSRNPVIGSYKRSRKEILRNVFYGTYRISTPRFNEKSRVIEYLSIPLHRDICVSLFRKCKGYSKISFDKKYRLYSVYSQYRAEWLELARLAFIEWNFYNADGTFSDFLRIVPFWRYRNWFERTYSYLYYDLELDVDTNWYCSRNAYLVGNELDSSLLGNWNCRVSFYIYLLDRYEAMRQSDVLIQFYTLFNDSVSSLGYAAAMAGAYPFGYPCSIRYPCDTSFNELFFHKRYFKYTSSEFYHTYLNQQLSRFQKRDKSKKVNNTYVFGYRKID